MDKLGSEPYAFATRLTYGETVGVRMHAIYFKLKETKLMTSFWVVISIVVATNLCHIRSF